MTLALLPAVVQMVILMVNGNLGTGVAVIFGGLTAFFALETVHILTLSKIPFVFALCALGCDMVYAVADAVKSGKK